MKKEQTAAKDPTDSRKKSGKKGMNPVVACVVIGVVAALAAVLWVKFGRFVQAANSVQWLEANLYSMEFKGDYGFDTFIEGGGADSDNAVGQFVAGYLTGGLYRYQGKIDAAPFGCSVFNTKNKAGAPRNCYYRKIDLDTLKLEFVDP